MKAKRLLAGCLVAVGIAAAVPGRGESTSESKGLVRYETATTWTTALAPEGHVLIENLTDREIGFDVRFRPSEIHCQGPVQKIGELAMNDRVSRYVTTFSGHRLTASGRLSPKGWGHRSLPLFVEPGSLPCEVPFRIVLDPPDYRVIDSTIAVAKGPPDRGVVPTASKDISVSILVETDECREQVEVVRLLVRNRSSHRIRVTATARGTKCDGNASAGFVPIGVLQGENTGPLDIDAKQWGVIVDVVRANSPSDFGACKGWVVLEGGDDRQDFVIDTVQFPLTPTGKLGCLLQERPRPATR